jgi:LysM repeat protein
MSITPDQYLSSEESADVEAALLTSSEKFLTRLTISSQRFLQKIAQDYQVSIEQLSHQQIIQWFENDSKVKREQGEDAETSKW